MKTHTNTMSRSLTLGTLALSFALALGAGAAQAQAPERGERGERGERRGPDPARMQERMEQRIEAMRAPLSLTPAQVAQLRAIFTETGEQMRAVHASEDLERGARRDAARAIRFRADDRIHAILSAEQREALRIFRRTERGEHRGMRGHHGRRGERGDCGERGERGERGPGRRGAAAPTAG